MGGNASIAALQAKQSGRRENNNQKIAERGSVASEPAGLQAVPHTANLLLLLRWRRRRCRRRCWRSRCRAAGGLLQLQHLPLQPLLSSKPHPQALRARPCRQDACCRALAPVDRRVAAAPWRRRPRRPRALRPSAPAATGRRGAATAPAAGRRRRGRGAWRGAAARVGHRLKRLHDLQRRGPPAGPGFQAGQDQIPHRCGALVRHPAAVGQRGGGS